MGCCHPSGGHGSGSNRSQQLSGKFCHCLASSSAHVIDAICQVVREGGIGDSMVICCSQMFGAGLFELILLLLVAPPEGAHHAVHLIHAVEVVSCFITSS